MNLINEIVKIYGPLLKRPDFITSALRSIDGLARAIGIKNNIEISVVPGEGTAEVIMINGKIVVRVYSGLVKGKLFNKAIGKYSGIEHKAAGAAFINGVILHELAHYMYSKQSLSELKTQTSAFLNSNRDIDEGFASFVFSTVMNLIEDAYINYKISKKERFAGLFIKEINKAIFEWNKSVGKDTYFSKFYVISQTTTLKEALDYYKGIFKGTPLEDVPNKVVNASTMQRFNMAGMVTRWLWENDDVDNNNNDNNNNDNDDNSDCGGGDNSNDSDTKNNESNDDNENEGENDKNDGDEDGDVSDNNTSANGENDEGDGEDNASSNGDKDDADDESENNENDSKDKSDTLVGGQNKDSLVDKYKDMEREFNRVMVGYGVSDNYFSREFDKIFQKTLDVKKVSKNEWIEVSISKVHAKAIEVDSRLITKRIRYAQIPPSIEANFTTFANRLSRLVSHDTTKFVSKSGRLHRRLMNKSQHSTSIYYQEVDDKGEDVEIAFVIDMSSSMLTRVVPELPYNGSFTLLTYATYVSMLMAKALANAGIKSSVYGHTANIWTGYFGDIESKTKDINARPMFLIDFNKEFGDGQNIIPSRINKKTLGELMLRLNSNSFYSNNRDAFPIKIAAQKMTANKKLIFVLSDGYPTAYSSQEADDVRRTPIALRKKGFGVYSFSLVSSVVARNNKIYGKEFNHYLKDIGLMPKIASAIVKSELKK